MSVDENFHLI